MELPSEPVKIQGDWQKHSATLWRHGATLAEIDFLRTRRVELNMMTAPVFIAFLERKLRENGVKKIIPDVDTLDHHARRIVAHMYAERAFKRLLPTILQESAAAPLPDDMLKRIQQVLDDDPELSWDLALNKILRENVTLATSNSP